MAKALRKPKFRLVGRPLIERLFERTIYVEITGCWNWVGPCSKGGYGSLQSKGKRANAHRLMYECTRGPVPEGMDLDHLCRNRRCVNPAHMDVVTRAENLLRGDGPRLTKERAAAKTVCKNGHDLTFENTYIHPKRGHRDCRICRQRRTKEYLERKRYG